jgi:hypothetical protein
MNKKRDPNTFQLWANGVGPEFRIYAWLRLIPVLDFHKDNLPLSSNIFWMKKVYLFFVLCR